jgi:dTDP-4-dehydrorhamnose reductase
MILALINGGVRTGIFHATNSGHTTWHGFATKLFDLSGWDPGRVHPATTKDFPRPAPRPPWSVLGHTNWSEHSLPLPRLWDQALEEAWSAGLSAFSLPGEKSL